MPVKSITLCIIAFLPLGIFAAQPDPVGVVTHSDQSVYRSFEAASMFGARTDWGTAYYLEFIGEKFDNPNNAIAGFDFYTNYLPSAIPSVVEAIIQENVPGALTSVSRPVVMDPPTIGDDAYALSVTADISMFASETFGMLVIREGRYVLTATVASNDPNIDFLSLLVSIVEPTMDRWDLADPIAVDETGIRSGGIWNLVPTSIEVPDGFVLDETYEEGPGPSSTSQQATSIGEKSGRSAPHPMDGETSSDRLAESFAVDFMIIMPRSTYQANSDGSCSGLGNFVWLDNDHHLALRTGDATQILSLSLPLEAGQITYDLELEDEVCVFDVSFKNVPARAEYYLSSYGTHLLQLGYDGLVNQGTIEIILTD